MSIANYSYLASGLTEFEIDGDDLANPRGLSMG